MNVAPRIAVVTPNVLTGIGLKSLLEKMMPGTGILLLERAEEVTAETAAGIAHWFVAAESAIAQSAFFSERRARCILLVEGPPQPTLRGYLCLNVCQSEEGLVRDMLHLRRQGHGDAAPHRTEKHPLLTDREADVLRLLVQGFLNKEIADRLGIATTTVITHRRNIIAKVGIRSLSGLTIYAVTQGYVTANQI